jgi:hypothetical protein
MLQRFLAGLATAELLRRLEAADAAAAHPACTWAPDLLLMSGWPLAAFFPFTGGEDPGCDHWGARSGYEILSDVCLVPLWCLVFHLGSLEVLDPENHFCGPLLHLYRLRAMPSLGR